MIEAVLFDWGGTLMQFAWSDELLEAGHRAGLAALGREDEADAITARFREVHEPLLREPGAADRIDYRLVLRDLLGDATGEELDSFVRAEHEVWAPSHGLASTTIALLEALRRRGLKLGVVANAWPEPPDLLREDLDRLGVAPLLDVVVFSGEVGARKPDAAIFRHALDALGVEAFAAMFVGDKRVDDIAGAAALGLTTVQALWFEADENPAGAEPDFMAFTQMDVLNVVRRLNGD